MPSSRKLTYSFNGGIIGPELLSRADLRQHQTGLRKAENFLIRPQGAAWRRPGLQYVNTAFNASSPAALIPFTFAEDQALVLEVSEGVIRFHTNGQTLLWATPMNIGASGWNVGKSCVEFLAPHGLADEDLIQFTETTGSLPTALSLGTSYYAKVVDGYRIEVHASLPLTTPLSLAGATPAYARAFRDSEMPADYVPSTAVTFDIANDEVDAVGHPFSNGDRVRFTVSGGSPAWPVAGVQTMDGGQDFWVVNAGADDFQLARAEGGSAETLTGSPSGTFTCHRYYVQGDLAYWTGGTIGAGVYYCTADHVSASEPLLTEWYLQQGSGVLTVPTTYGIDEVPDINWAQSSDILTLVDRRHPERELRRLGAYHWDLRPVPFAPPIDAPANLGASESRGESWLITGISVTSLGTAAEVTLQSAHDLAKGNPVVIWNNSSSTVGHLQTSFDPGETKIFVVDENISSGFAARLTLRQMLEGAPVANAAAYTGSPPPLSLAYADLEGDVQQTYVVTAVNEDGVESLQSDAATADNSLAVPGSYNRLTWSAVSGAVKYYIYKDFNGVYGRIGESSTTSFDDDNIGPDIGLTPPILDSRPGGTNYSRAVGYFQQRRAFAGFVEDPRLLLASRTATESSFTYHIPIQDTDRLRASLAARSAHVIRHIVPTRDLLLLTQQGSYRLVAENSDAITPESISIDPQEEIGASRVQPVVADDRVVFAANRGGHLMSSAFALASQGYSTDDLSLLAYHLFDDLDIRRIAHGRSPFQFVATASSNGRAPFLTMVPRQGIAAWSEIVTDGDVESVCVVPEGRNDALYISVRRTVNGSDVRYIERCVLDRPKDVESGIYLDSSAIYDGLQSSTIRATGGQTWRAGETVTLTASDHAFAGPQDVGNEVELRTADGERYRIEVTSFANSKVVAGRIKRDLPASLRSLDASSWAYAVRTISGLDHLEGKAVEALADGVVVTGLTVSGGSISVQTPATRVVCGLPYVSLLETLPMAIEAEALGQGVLKSVRSVIARYADTAGGVEAGAVGQSLYKVEDLDEAELRSVEARCRVAGDMSTDGAAQIRMAKPLPCTVTGIIIDASFGG